MKYGCMIKHEERRRRRKKKRKRGSTFYLSICHVLSSYHHQWQNKIYTDGRLAAKNDWSIDGWTKRIQWEVWTHTFDHVLIVKVSQARRICTKKKNKRNYLGSVIVTDRTRVAHQ